jgi:glycine C-acetyltransferase/8-amino-7-oxononanoate synthase
MTDLQARLDELEQLGLRRRMRLVSGPQGPRVVLDGKPGPAALLEQLPRAGRPSAPARGRPPTRRCAGASAPGASRLVSGTMTIHRRLEASLAAFKGTESALLFGSGYLANLGVVSALAGEGQTSSPTSSTTRRSSTAAAWRAPDRRVPPRRRRAPRVADRPARASAAA